MMVTTGISHTDSNEAVASLEAPPNPVTKVARGHLPQAPTSPTQGMTQWVVVQKPPALRQEPSNYQKLGQLAAQDPSTRDSQIQAVLQHLPVTDQTTFLNIAVERVSRPMQTTIQSDGNPETNFHLAIIRTLQHGSFAIPYYEALIAFAQGEDLALYSSPGMEVALSIAYVGQKEALSALLSPRSQAHCKHPEPFKGKLIAAAQDPINPLQELRAVLEKARSCSAVIAIEEFQGAIEALSDSVYKKECQTLLEQNSYASLIPETILQQAMLAAIAKGNYNTLFHLLNYFASTMPGPNSELFYEVIKFTIEQPKNETTIDDPELISKEDERPSLLERLLEHIKSPQPRESIPNALVPIQLLMTGEQLGHILLLLVSQPNQRDLAACIRYANQHQIQIPSDHVNQARKKALPGSQSLLDQLLSSPDESHYF